MNNSTDQQLIKTYLNGDEKALEVLIKRYLKQVYRFVYRYASDAPVAEDITQETFLKVWRNLRKFDREMSFKTWIYAIAQNTALDFIRKRNSVPFSAFEDIDGRNIFTENLLDTSCLPDEMAEQANMKDILALAMKKLSLKYRRVLSLYYNKHFNLREISQILGESLNTVKSRHRRGLILLREIVSQS